MKKKIITLLLACSSFCLFAGAQPVDQKKFLQQLDSFTTRLAEKIPGIPAIAVTVVNDRGVMFNKTWGWANKEAGIKADLNTLFYLASSTKSFTALAATLIDHEKKIMLDSPMRKYLSNIPFKAEISNDVTIKSLLAHTSGIVNSPLTFRMSYTGSVDDNEMRAVLANATEVKTKPGVYLYDNVGYNIYAMTLQEYLHQKWQDVLQKKIFTPLGMKHTTAYVSEAIKNKWPIAATYNAFGPNGLEILNLNRGDNTMQSAGGLISTPSDIAIWLQANINAGRVKDKQVFPEQVMKTVHSVYASFEKGSGLFSAAGESALGWALTRYHNEKVIYKFGKVPGSMSHISFMPDKKTGIAIFMNEGSIGGPASDLIAGFIYDWITQGDNVELAYLKKLDELEAAYKAGLLDAQRSFADRAKRVSQLSMPLETYTGKYRHTNFGEIEIVIENNNLAVRMGSMYNVSTPFTQKESIRVEMPAGSGQVILFKTDETGKINALRYAGADYKRVM